MRFACHSLRCQMMAIDYSLNFTTSQLHNFFFNYYSDVVESPIKKFYLFLHGKYM